MLYPLGVLTNLKRAQLSVAFAIACLLPAVVFCPGQTAPAQTPANQSGQPTPSTSQTAPATQTPPADPSKADHSQKENQAAKDANASDSNSKDRLFFALPNFLTVENAANVQPLTAGGKFKLVGRSAFDPAQFVWYAGLAGISQAENSEPGFGQGAEGYGKRYGAYVADGTIENFFVGAIFPSMLHTDPRFFQSGKGTFWRRAGYAITRAVVTRNDSGKNVFNASEIFGSAVASSISTYSYHPHPGYHPVEGMDVPYIASDRTLKNTASVWASQVGYDTITFAIKEFWPDVRRKMKKQH
jgi:hypothetical protein